jgi:hypothetical protein
MRSLDAREDGRRENRGRLDKGYQNADRKNEFWCPTPQGVNVG